MQQGRAWEQALTPVDEMHQSRTDTNVISFSAAISARETREQWGQAPTPSSKLVAWQVGLNGIQVGEASHPGPGGADCVDEAPWPFDVSDEEFVPRPELEVAPTTPEDRHGDAEQQDADAQAQHSWAQPGHDFRSRKCTRSKKCVHCQGDVDRTSGCACAEDVEPLYVQWDVSGHMQPNIHVAMLQRMRTDSQ